jgi:hypothetical protein
VSFRFGQGLAFGLGVPPQLEVLCEGAADAGEFRPAGPGRVVDDRLVIDFPADPAAPAARAGPRALRLGHGRAGALVNDASLPRDAVRTADRSLMKSAGAAGAVSP